jgi:putative transposase
MMYDSDLTDAARAIVEPQLPAALPGGRPRTTDVRAVVNAIFYLLRSGCQWRLLPREYPPRSTVYHYFRAWRSRGVWTELQWELHRRPRLAAGRAACPTVVIMDGQSVKTTEGGGRRGFDGHKRVKGRKRHILVGTLGLPIASRVEPANISDRKAGYRLLGGLRFAFPNIRTVIADAGHESRKLARELKRHDGYELRIVERSFAWLGRYRRLSKDYEFRVQTSEAMIDIAATRLILNRIVSA